MRQWKVECSQQIVASVEARMWQASSVQFWMGGCCPWRCCSTHQLRRTCLAPNQSLTRGGVCNRDCWEYR